MNNDLKYIELKSGYSDDGPAWIGRVKFSKTGKTLYFNDHAFQRIRGISGNYIDIETGEEYWISGVKKDECNRYAGIGKIIIDAASVEEYLKYIGAKTLSNQYIVMDMKSNFPVERIKQILNEKQ